MAIGFDDQSVGHALAVVFGTTSKVDKTAVDCHTLHRIVQRSAPGWRFRAYWGVVLLTCFLFRYKKETVGQAAVMAGIKALAWAV